MKSPYEEIIDLPHHVSAARPRMPMKDRAAQFSPFAALTGYDAEIKETGRLTEEWVEMGEDCRDVLDRKKSYLMRHVSEHPALAITYFLPDQRKKGGSYETVTGSLKRFDEDKRLIILMNGVKIPIDRILNIESAVFRDLFE